MRRDAAHTAQRSTGDVGDNRKAQFDAFSRVIGLGRGASCSGHVPQRIEEPITNRSVAGWNPAVPAMFVKPAPVAALTANRAISSGRSQRTGLVPTVILHFAPEEIKVQSDLSQLPYRNGQGWLLRETPRPAVQVPAVR